MNHSYSSENNMLASGVRFQRSSIALLSFIAVVFNTPIPSYFIILTSFIAICFSPRSELLRLFYAKVIRKLLGRDLFSFKHIFPGSFLLDVSVERFIFSGLLTAQGLGVVMYHLGIKWWVVPIAFAAGAKTLSATIGICIMAYAYALVAEWRKHRLALR